ncbi:MAG: DUF4041 domain-containing protein, partial [Hespellia sp.]|nr:DUF4041 domain-containing protein [Hespellia sp.]
RQLQEANNQLLMDNDSLRQMLTPEMREAQKLKEYVGQLNAQHQQLQQAINTTNYYLTERNEEIRKLDETIASKKNQIIELDDAILLQEFGMYTPVYNLMNSEAYKDRLVIIRQKQKDMVKNNTACTFPQTFTLDGSLTKGKKLVKDNVKQILRAFNNECDAVIDKVKFNNIESIRKKIEKSYNDLNKMNAGMQIAIVYTYLQYKLEELNLCYEYAVKKQEEKEEQKRIREQLREEAKLQKEIEEVRKTIEKEKTHYENALDKLQKQIDVASDEEKSSWEEKKAEILAQLEDIQKSITDIDYREANKRAGYVYVISNIGAFGENVFKIGMTRRLEPTERVDELGDASVPFNFDIHAMIFSEDAPALETALHKAFEERKLNMVNTRREFFRVTLDEIEAVVKKNFDKTVEFTRVAPAERYRESLMMKREMRK